MIGPFHVYVAVKRGDHLKTFDFLKRLESQLYLLSPTTPYLDKLGVKGVVALREATPKDTGLTSNLWTYEIIKTSTSVTISWSNPVMAGTAPLTVMLQYGHGTRQGGYVEGIDYINPALRPIFDEIAEEAWRELTK